MTTENIQSLTDEEIQLNARDMLIALATCAREKKQYILFGTECYDFIVSKGAKVKTSIDLCHGSATDTAEFMIGGFRFVVMRHFRKLTTEEFNAAVDAQRSKLSTP